MIDFPLCRRCHRKYIDDDFCPECAEMIERESQALATEGRDFRSKDLDKEQE